MSSFNLGLIDWDVTARCNLACSHCYAYGIYGDSPPPDLDTAACFAIIDRIYAHHGAQLILLYGGEPLLRSDLEQLSSRITAHGAECGLVTNGILLTPDRSHTIRSAGISTIAVSLDAASRESYLRFRGRDTFTRAVAGCRAAVGAGLDVSLGFVLCQANAAEASHAVSLSAEIGARRVIFTPLAYDGRARQSWNSWDEAVLTPVEIVDLAYTLIEGAVSGNYPVDNIDLNFATPVLIECINTALGTTLPLPTRGCQPLRNLFIRADGCVFPCKGMVPGLTMKRSPQTSSGYNLIDTSLMHVLGSPDFGLLFELSGDNHVRQGLPPICRDCSYLFNLCQPCPLAAADPDCHHAEYCHDYPVSDICRESRRRLEG